jgi:hypothetical protein
MLDLDDDDDRLVPRAARQRFFVLLAETGDEYAAAAQAGVTPRELELLREFWCEEWADAELESEAMFVTEGRRRALEVLEQPVLYRGRPVLKSDGTPLTHKRYNDRMMIRMLELSEEDLGLYQA